MTGWRRWLAAALLVVVGMVVLPSVAVGAPFGSCANPPEPVMPRTGASGLVTAEPVLSSVPDRAPDPFADSKVAIADVYGWGWHYDTYDLGCGLDVLSDAGWVSGNHAANFLFSINTAGIAILDALEKVAKGSGFDWLTNMAGTIATALAPLVVVWLPITIALLGVLVVWRSKRNHYQDTFGSLLIALVAIGVSAIAFTAPTWLANVADQAVLQVQSTAMGTIAQSGSSSDLIARESLYRSWLVGQFGDDGPTAQKYGPRLFKATHYSWSDVKQIRRDPQAESRLREVKQQQFTELAKELEQNDSAAYNAFRGRTDRVGPAVLSAVMGFATGMFVWTCLAMLLLCRILMQAIAVIVPLMAVLGVLPSGWGFLQSAWDRFTAALIGVAKFTLASGVMTIVLGAVMAAPLSTPEKLLWIVLLSVVGFVVTKPFHTLKTITPGLDPNVHYLAKAIGLAAGVKWLTTETKPAEPAPADAGTPAAEPLAAPTPAPEYEPLVAVGPSVQRPALAAAPLDADHNAGNTGSQAYPMPPGPGPTPRPGPGSGSGAGVGARRRDIDPDEVIYPSGVVVQSDVYRSDGLVEQTVEYVKLPEPTLDDLGQERDDLLYRPADIPTGGEHHG